MNMKTNKQNSFLHKKWIICFTFATLCLEFYKSAVYLFFSLSGKQKIDLILLDIKMPIMDGITAAKIIAADNIAPVLLLTAYSQQDIVEKASDAGVIAYLVKPVREEQLFPAMEIAAKRFQEMHKLNLELDKLKESLETRKLLDRAKGILMAAHGMTEQEAYRKMQQFSMAKRISLKELAESIIAAAAKRQQ